MVPGPGFAFDRGDAVTPPALAALINTGVTVLTVNLIGGIHLYLELCTRWIKSARTTSLFFLTSATVTGLWPRKLISWTENHSNKSFR